ncbi:M17 family metallopeptidase [Roseomonas sp. CCTCC AB2023176]|uniref:leucyl aminopeptidase family protein n=1 Tax=Roseomonas sp. CCTCC AB2023176 TaxID=3342640 RepID=UPI0035D77B48
MTQAGAEEILSSLAPAAASYLRETGFRGKVGQVALVPGPSGAESALVGLGDDPGSPWGYGAAPMALPEGSAWILGEGCEAAAATLGWALGAYRPARHKAPSRRPALLVTPPGTGEVRALALAALRARELINLPAADLGPAELAAAVREVAEACGGTYEEIGGAALEEGYPAVAAVGRGSHRAPRVAMLRWEGAPDGPLVAICGKGVCFDTGGLDLKPPAAMLRMKKDMGGAAIALALAETLMRRRAPVRLLLLVGAVENAVSATAMRPLDVLRTRAGITVEVGNTDAEGRLVLADLLARAAEEKPDLLLDLATLTGAARVALGPDLPALFCDDDGVAEALLRAGRENRDPLWRLPLHSEYGSWLDSSAADISNVATKPMAGAVIAALFLRRFVPDGIHWAHLDVYAWNDSGRPGRPEGGEAQGLRALTAGVTALLPILRTP